MHRKRQQSSMDGTVRFRQNHCRPQTRMESTLWYRPQTRTESTLWYKQSHSVPHRQIHSYILLSKRNQNEPKSSLLFSQSRPQSQMQCVLLSKRNQNEPKSSHLFSQSRPQSQMQCILLSKRNQRAATCSARADHRAKCSVFCCPKETKTNQRAATCSARADHRAKCSVFCCPKEPKSSHLFNQSRPQSQMQCILLSKRTKEQPPVQPEQTTEPNAV